MVKREEPTKQRGVAMLEQAVLLALISVGIAGVVAILGNRSADTFCSIQERYHDYSIQYRWDPQQKRCLIAIDRDVEGFS